MAEVLAGAALLFMPTWGLPILGGTIYYQHFRSRNKTARNGNRRSSNTLDVHNGSEEWEMVPEPTYLKWSELTCIQTLPPNSHKNSSENNIEEDNRAQRKILDNLSGQANPGELLAVMGPSGSGKTTLCKIWAQQMPYDKHMHVTGYLTVNGHPSTSNHYKQAFIQQEDLFFSQLTARETLELAAELHLPESLPAQTRQRKIDEVLRKLGLQQCADTIVGDAKTGGLSGGEKKRLSIACQLLGCPSLIIADEPTTGLDAFQALQVMKSFKQLAKDGHTVVVTIHQPRSSIWDAFDKILLLAQGTPVYFGAASEALDHFESLGYPCPEHYNPAEFIADLISVDTSSQQLKKESEERIKSLCDSYRAIDSPIDVSIVVQDQIDQSESSIGPRISMMKQFKLLFGRAWKQVKRDKKTIKVRALTSVKTALIFGSVWYRLQRTYSKVPSRLGLIQVVVTYIAQTSIFKTLNVFPKEKTIVSRERAQAAYAVAPYLAAKTAAELPYSFLYPALFCLPLYPLTGLCGGFGRFLNFVGLCTLDAFAATSLSLAIGAAAPSTEVALVLGPAISIVFIVFGGLYIKIDDVPLIWRWIPKISMITRAYEGMVLNEFKGTYLDPEEGDIIPKYCGDDVVEQVGFEDLSIRTTVGASLRVMMFNYWITYLILKSQKPRFQPLEEPQEEESQVEQYVQA